MASFRYVSDNPYRLLGVGSALGPDDLCRRAAATAQATFPRQAAQVGLRRVFGDEDLARCEAIARSLAIDPKRRTIYRCFWPLHYESLPDAALFALPGPSAPPFVARQIAFLENWFAFLTTSDPGRLGNALADFRALRDDGGYAAGLARLLADEGEDEADARRLVEEAHGEVVALLLTAACRRAVESWESGQTAGPWRALLRAVIASPFPEAADQALRAEVIPAGDREMAGLRRAINAGGSPAASDPAVLRLRELAEAVRERVPTAALWLQTAQERSRPEAPRPSPAPRPQPESRENAAAGLEKVGKIQGDSRIWKDVRRIESAPTVFHFLGTGTRMIGRRPFGGQSAWYYSTLCLCVFFVPLFPLGRYVISYTPWGGYYFHGRAPLTQENRSHIYLAATALLLLAILASLRLPAVSKALSRVTASPSGSAPTLTSPAPARESKSGVVLSTEEERQNRLAAEWETLNEQNEAELPKMMAEAAELEERDREIRDTLSQIKAEKAVLDRSDERAVDAFNLRLIHVNETVREAARSWKEHNRRVDAYNERAERLVEISRVLRRKER